MRNDEIGRVVGRLGSVRASWVVLVHTYAALRCACKNIFFVSTSALVLARYNQSARGMPYINIHSLLVMTFTVLLALHIVSSALQVF